MQAILVDGRDWSGARFPTPSPGTDRCYRSARRGVNRADLKRAGQYPPPPDGGVDGVGGGRRCSRGTGLQRWGRPATRSARSSAAEVHRRVAVPADMALPVPDRLSMVEAARRSRRRSPHLNLCVEAGMGRGTPSSYRRGGGLGMAAIQLAKTLTPSW